MHQRPDRCNRLRCVLSPYERRRFNWPVDPQAEDRVKRLLKAELARKGITYAPLVGKLADIGVMDSEPNIRNKISRGKFTAVFLMQCLEAIGAETIKV
jgi:hypothetical protein